VTADLPDRLRRLAASMAVPQTLTAAGLHDRFGDPNQLEPAVGQVWRAEWSNVSRLVLLLGAQERHWRVAPVSVEPTGEDDHGLVISAGHTGFPVEVTVWVGLATSIPTGTLSRMVDNYASEITAWCVDMAAGTVREPPAGTRRGRPAVDALDGSTSVRASLADDLDTLVVAPLVPVRAPAAVDLKAATARVGLPTVVAALDLPQSTVMKIVQGKQTATEQQAEILAGLLGYRAEEILGAAGLPIGLAIELEQPRWRPAWRSIARRFNVSEFAARLRAGSGTYAMAFRQTGAAAPNWRSRIDQWLAANGGQTSGAEHDK